MMKYKSPESAASRLFQLLLELVLLFQILSTALYYNGYFTNPLINKFLLGQISALTAWLIYGLRSLQNRKFQWVHSPYYLPTAILAVWAGFRSFVAPTPEAPTNFYIFAAMVSVFPLWVLAFRKSQFRRLYPWTVFFAGVCLILGCFRQLATVDPKFEWTFFPAMTLTPGSYERQRLGSFLGHNNACSSYLWIAALFAISLAYRFRRSLGVIIFWLYTVVTLVIIYLAGSRGVTLMISPSLALLLYGWFKKGKNTQVSADSKSKSDTLSRRTTFQPQKFWIPITATALVCLIILGIWLSHLPLAQKGIAGVYSRFLTSPDTLLSGTYPRCWWFSLLMVREQPVWGVGFSAWPFVYPDFQERWFTEYPQTKIGLPEKNKMAQQAHNDYLQTWAELGLPGLICMLWLLGIHARYLWKFLRKPGGSMFAAAATSAVAATLIRALFAFPFHEAAESCLFLANLALFSWYAEPRLIEWSPAWLTHPLSKNHLWMSVLLIPVFFLAAFPVQNYLVGDYIARMYGIDVYWAGQAMQKGDNDTAQRYFDRGYGYLVQSLKYLPQDGLNLYTLGAETYTRAKTNKDKTLCLQSIEYLQRSLKTYSYYETYGHLGRAYRLLWELTQSPDYLSEAAKNMQKAVAIMPVFEEGWMELGIIYDKLGKTQEALNLLIGTHLRFPGFIERTILPQALEAETQKELETAGTLLNLAATINPQSESVFQEVIAFYVRNRHEDMADKMFLHIAPQQKSDKVMEMLTLYLLERLHNQKREESFRFITKLLQEDKLNTIPNLWYYSGLVAWLAGHPWDSLANWNKALELGVPNEQLIHPLKAAAAITVVPLLIP